MKQPVAAVADREPTNESAESASDGEKSFNSQIEVGEAMLDQDGKDEAAFQTPVSKQVNVEDDGAVEELIPEQRQSLGERDQNNEAGAAGQVAQANSEQLMKENAAPGEETSAAQ